MILYHLSPKWFKVIDPDKSKTARKECWLMKAEILIDKIDHIRKRHNEPIRYLYSFNFPNAAFSAIFGLKNRGKGMYTINRRKAANKRQRLRKPQ